MKTVAIVQARMGSSRLPGKVMMPVNDTPLIGLLLARLALSKEIDEIVVATSTEPENQKLADYVATLNYACVRGSEDDVLARFMQAAEKAKADVIVRITGDCPLIDAGLVDDMLHRFSELDVDYLNNCDPPTFPNGLDTEIFTMDALRLAHDKATDVSDREHVTPYLRFRETVRRETYKHQPDLSAMRWTVDEAADFEVVKAVFDHFAPDRLFSWDEIVALTASHPNLFEANVSISRNEGMHLTPEEKKARFEESKE